ncbi:hypothetical protein CF326_g9682 [Tilletia indica]|nr:hypothetical protein CF326_g9682 [Tilletia indica]
MAHSTSSLVRNSSTSWKTPCGGPTAVSTGHERKRYFFNNLRCTNNPLSFLEFNRIAARRAEDVRSALVRPEWVVDVMKVNGPMIFLQEEVASCISTVAKRSACHHAGACHLNSMAETYRKETMKV